MARLQKTLADYVAIAISPALIMVLVGSLVFFLAGVFYQGAYPTRLNIIMGLFVFASVLIARISIEQGRAHAAPFAIALACAVGFALFRFVEYEGAIPPSLTMFVNLILMVIIWWSADKLTYDCTVIDEGKRSSSEGLMQTIGFDDEPARGQAPKQAAAKPGDEQVDGEKANQNNTPGASEPAGTTSRGEESDKPRSWWDRHVERKGRPHAPGLWVVYFSLAALPIFGFGQGLIPASDVETRRWVFWLFCAYLAAGLGLLISTSFLGLRRYLRQRQVEMPSSMAGWWLVTGSLLVLGLLVITALLPRPAAEYAVSELSFTATSSIDTPSDFAMGGEGVATKNSGRGTTESSQQPNENSPTASGRRNDSNQQDSNRGGDSEQGSQSSQSNQGEGNQGGSNQDDSGDQSSDSQSGNSSDQNNSDNQQGDQSSNQSSGDQQSGDSQSGGSQGDQQSGDQDSQGNQQQGDRQQGNNDQSASQQDSDGDNSDGQNNGQNTDSQQGGDQSQGDDQSQSGNGANEQSQNRDDEQERGNQRQNNRSNSSSGSGGGRVSENSNNEENSEQNEDENEGGSGEAEDESGGSGSGSSSSFDGEAAAANDSPDLESESWFDNVDWLTTGFKWLIYLIVAIVVIYVLIRHGKEILRGFREFLANLKAFLLRLFGGAPPKAKEAAVAKEQEKPTGPPPRPFSSYADPFSSGMADKVPPQELVRYSFEAFEAWARDQGRPRGEEETPHEFAHDVARSSRTVAKDARNLADLYDHAAYAPQGVTTERAMTLSGLWRRLRGKRTSSSSEGMTTS